MVLPRKKKYNWKKSKNVGKDIFIQHLLLYRRHKKYWCQISNILDDIGVGIRRRYTGLSDK